MTVGDRDRSIFAPDGGSAYR